MRVLMIPNDFPTNQEPYRTYFNYLEAKELRKFVDLRVLWFRAWLPGRKPIQTSVYNGIPVITATAPVIPNSNFAKINLMLYHRFVWPFIYSYFEQVDIIHSIGVDFAGLLGGIWAKKTNLHHVTQLIAEVNYLKSDFRSYPYFDNLTKNLHGIACNSKSLVNLGRKLFPKTANIKHIYRGVDLVRFTPHGPTIGPLKDYPPTRFLFLGGLPFYGSYKFKNNYKGGVTLMTAWKEAEDDLFSLGAYLLFAGPEGNNGIAKNWRDGLKYPGNVFLSGMIKFQDIPAILRASDVVLVPSMSDGFPNVVFEAAACARPVFGSNIDCISEIVVNGETGLLIPAGDISKWRSILIRYADSAKITQLKQMGICARKQMESSFDYRNYAPQMVDLYRDAMECSLHN